MEIIKQFLLSTIGSILVLIFGYEFIEVRKKRKIETYWKIEEQYRSEEQKEARSVLVEVEKKIEIRREKIQSDGNSGIDVTIKLKEYYNKAYHKSSKKKERDKARKIRYRIRFLHQVGILLRKKMIDKDLLFSLIGMGFEIDYNILSFILECHREVHGQELYNQFDYLWKEYKGWKEKTKIKKNRIISILGF